VTQVPFCPKSWHPCLHLYGKIIAVKSFTWEAAGPCTVKHFTTVNNIVRGKQVNDFHLTELEVTSTLVCYIAIFTAVKSSIVQVHH